tara:strand:+ start:1336 stop:1644 length:309 start_codon:yes stop_codon:yes gene_type:complete
MKTIQLLLMFTMLLGLGACAGGPQDESFGQAIDSAAITTRVKTQLLKDESVSGTDINVDTFKNTVLLSGFVRSKTEKSRAERIAAQVQGVDRVTNNIVVRGE